jgi:hypothetical protein
MNKFNLKNEINKLKYDNLNVSALSDAVTKEEIIADVIAGAPTLAGLNPFTGHKAGTTVEMPILDASVVWTNSLCNSEATGGDVVLAPRNAKINQISYRTELCIDKISAKLPQIMSAGARNEDLPFASLLVNYLASLNVKEVEKAAWQGDSDLTGTTNNLNKVEAGWLKIASGETADLAHYATFTAFTVSNAVALFQDSVIAKLPEDAFTEGTEITAYLSNTNFVTLQRALVNDYGVAATGIFQNTGAINQAGTNEMYWPGYSNIKIKATYGLSKANGGDIFVTTENNLAYLTDLESDMEDVDVFFDKKSKSLIVDMVFALGFQYAFPGNVIYLKRI